MLPSGIEIFLKGQGALNAEHTSRETSKIHTLRGGSAGCLLPSGGVLGACPHHALGRFLGYQLNTELAQTYFDAGIANELIWERNFIAAMGKERIRCEEEIPVIYPLDGFNITGRPDLVVGESIKGKWTPQYGYELKSAHTLKSASKKLYGYEVGADHLCQAGFYAKLLDVPYSIIYNTTISGELPKRIANEYGYTELIGGKVEIPIEWRDDVLYYTTPDGREHKTLITWTGIIDYYRSILEMYKTKTVGVLHRANVDATGKRLYYDPNQYNDFTLAVPVNKGWNSFESHLKRASNIRRLINFARGKYKVIEVPFHTVDGLSHTPHLYKYTKENSSTYETLDEARDAFYDGY